MSMEYQVILTAYNPKQSQPFQLYADSTTNCTNDELAELARVLLYQTGRTLSKNDVIAQTHVREGIFLDYLADFERLLRRQMMDVKVTTRVEQMFDKDRLDLTHKQTRQLMTDMTMHTMSEAYLHVLAQLDFQFKIDDGTLLPLRVGLIGYELINYLVTTYHLDSKLMISTNRLLVETPTKKGPQK